MRDLSIRRCYWERNDRSLLSDECDRANLQDQRLTPTGAPRYPAQLFVRRGRVRDRLLQRSLHVCVSLRKTTQTHVQHRNGSFSGAGELPDCEVYLLTQRTLLLDVNIVQTEEMITSLTSEALCYANEKYRSFLQPNRQAVCTLKCCLL